MKLQVRLMKYGCILRCALLGLNAWYNKLNAKLSFGHFCANDYGFLRTISIWMDWFESFQLCAIVFRVGNFPIEVCIAPRLRANCLAGSVRFDWSLAAFCTCIIASIIVSSFSQSRIYLLDWTSFLSIQKPLSHVETINPIAHISSARNI